MYKYKLSLSSQEILYIVKCILGVLLCYGFYAAFPQYPFYWSIISVVLVFTPDNDQTLAFDRIKANFMGSGIGLLVFLLPVTGVFQFCLGVAATILIGITLKLENTIRPALAAVIIVLVQEKEHPDWHIAWERAGCVLLGCFTALCITLVFTKVAWAKFYYKLQHALKRP